MAFETQTENQRALGFVLSEAEHGRSRDEVTIASGSGVLKAGTVLGEITADGKFAPAPHAETTDIEGAETATAVLAYPVDATSADVKAVVIARAAQVKQLELVYDDSVDNAAKTATKVAQLAAVGIITR